MSIPRVTIIDYGHGNLLSVQRALEFCGAKVTSTSNSDQILKAQRVVLPGVGAFANAMHALEKLKLVEVIREICLLNTPLLGICLGMQLLFDESDEFGLTAGLGIIPGRVISVPNFGMSGNVLKIPHIGWSSLQPASKVTRWQNTILQDLNPNDATYFIHSYMAAPSNASHSLAECLYGGNKITAVVAKDNTIGCQFHPEKSGVVGLRVLDRFLKEV